MRTQDAFPRHAGPLLGRFHVAMQQLDDAEKIGRILAETGDVDPVVRATAGGDERRLRGIPCIARGVAGVAPGTDPRSVVRTLS